MDRPTISCWIFGVSRGTPCWIHPGLNHAAHRDAGGLDMPWQLLRDIYLCEIYIYIYIYRYIHIYIYILHIYYIYIYMDVYV